MRFEKIKNISKKILKYYIVSTAIFFTIFIVLCFTSLPFWMYYYLGISTNSLKENPDYIVVLGGGGMPSESGLMRTYFATESANNYPKAEIIIALPGDTTDTTSAVFLMKQELLKRGVENKISFEPNGTNTRSQAIEILKLVNPNKNILIISSPEHMYRAVKTFVKLGFKNAGGKPAFETAIESQLFFDDDDLGGNRIIPGIGENTQLRYQFWNHMKYQIIVYREYMAIVYYKLKSWI